MQIDRHKIVSYFPLSKQQQQQQQRQQQQQQKQQQHIFRAPGHRAAPNISMYDIANCKFIFYHCNIEVAACSYKNWLTK